MKRIFIVIFSLLSCVFAQDWYSYMNKTHIDILREFGVPDLMKVEDTNSFVVFDEHLECPKSYDLSIKYEDLGVKFIFDNQGGIKSSWSRENNKIFYEKSFGKDGILRVCGMHFYENCKSILPYDLKIGSELTDVLTNNKLGIPERYTPECVCYKISSKIDNEERGIVKGFSSMQNEVTEIIEVYLEDGKVKEVLFVRRHRVEMSFR